MTGLILFFVIIIAICSWITTGIVLDITVNRFLNISGTKSEAVLAAICGPFILMAFPFLPPETHE